MVKRRKESTSTVEDLLHSDGHNCAMKSKALYLSDDLSRII